MRWIEVGLQSWLWEAQIRWRVTELLLSRRSWLVRLGSCDVSEWNRRKWLYKKLQAGWGMGKARKSYRTGRYELRIPCHRATFCSRRDTQSSTVSCRVIDLYHTWYILNYPLSHTLCNLDDIQYTMRFPNPSWFRPGIPPNTDLQRGIKSLHQHMLNKS